MVANLGGIFWAIFYIYHYSDTPNTGSTHVILELVGCSIALILQDFFFLVAHWIFAIQYFALSRNFPLIQAKKDTSESDMKFKRIREYFIVLIAVIVTMC